MKHHKEVDALIAQAEAAGICIYGRTKSHCSALIRRAKELELKRVFPSYAGKLQADGVFGAKTAAAVKEFQRRAKISSDGVVGPKTRAALRKHGVKL